MDHVTVNQESLAYARVCVEIDAAMEIPKFIDVEALDGNVTQIFVRIPWMPMKCSSCKIFVYSDKTCSSKGNHVQK